MPPKKSANGASTARTTKKQRTTRTEPESNMTVILRDVPPGYDWGWFSREDPRMHLQTVDKAHRSAGYKVWLENRGKKAFQPEEGIPAKVLKRLEAEVNKERQRIEDWWTVFMIENQWLNHALQGSQVAIACYPQFPGSRFTRTIDLADYLAGIYSPTSQLVAREKRPVKPEEVGISSELCSLEIYPRRDEAGRHHIYLPDVLWQD